MILIPTTLTVLQKLKRQAKELKKRITLPIRKHLKLLPAKQVTIHGIMQIGVMPNLPPKSLNCNKTQIGQKKIKLAIVRLNNYDSM